MKTSLIPDRPFVQNMLRIALPIALQNLLSTTASMVDTVMIGTQGELAVAAVGICAQFSSLLFSAYFGFSSGGSLFFAQFFGARDERGIAKAYGITLTCMMFVGFLFGGVTAVWPEFILGVYTDKVSIQQVAAPYLRIVAISFPLQTLAMAMSTLLRSTEKVKVPLFASIASLGTNLVVNYLLIFGKLGLPQMGVRGAAIGTLAAGIVNVLVLFFSCLRDKETVVLRVREQFGWEAALVKGYFIKCLPIIINELLFGVGQMIINIVIGRQDEAGIAAMAAFRVIEGLVYTFFVGLATASSVMVGKQVGAGEHVAAYRDAKRFAILCPMITLAITLIVVPFREVLLRVFGLGEVALQYGMIMLLIYTVASAIRTCNYILNGIFRAGGEPVFGTVFEIVGLYCLTVSAVVISGLVLRAPFLIVFTLMYTDEIPKLLIAQWYLRSGRWIKPVTEEGKANLPAFRKIMKNE
jgi:putative MATE family efflux protein